MVNIPTQNRLIAFTNTQGRLINESADPCNTASSKVTGRFISIEQEFSELRQNSSGWLKVSNALARTFPKTLSTKNYDLNISIYPNPTSGKFFIEAQEIQQIEVYNLFGQRILTLNNYGKNTAFVNLEITFTEPGIKGDTATNTLKPATVEGGAEVRVPLFIGEGEKIWVDTASGDYKERYKD